MKAKFLFLTFILVSYSLSAQDQPPYIEAFKGLAMQEMERTGIPASITLAQGILESSWGKGVLARSSNNHFGIKCKSDWEGENFLLEDDDFNSDGELIKSCFRAYESVEESYFDHSNFLKNRSRYLPLFQLDPTDYSSWAIGLQNLGYATDPDYANKLIKNIEAYQLYRYDLPVEELVMEAPEFELPVEPEQSIAFEIDVPETAKKETAPRLTLHKNFGLVPVVNRIVK